jgi:pilus assembly protein Flp/PilA
MNALLSLYVYVKSMFEVEEGQDLIEYALIIGLVVIAGIVGLSLLGGQIADLWAGIGTELTNAAP